MSVSVSVSEEPAVVTSVKEAQQLMREGWEPYVREGVWYLMRGDVLRRVWNNAVRALKWELDA